MPFYPLPAQEMERLEKLRSYEILDSLPEEAHVRITRLAAKTFNVPIAAISLIEGDKLWFKAHIGNAYNEISRKLTFCAHAICQDEVFVVEDATKDPRFSDNPYVTGAPHLRFYAGAPLRASGGLNLGTVNILDTKPRTITDDERESLADLAAMVIDSFEMRQLLNRANAAERRFIDAMESLPNGFVLYDKDDRLVICNERYREIYAESAKYIVPGASFEEIIRNGVENGQYPDAIGNEEAWIAERLEMHQNPGEPIEQHLPGDTWLRVQERRTSEGGLVGFRFDITELKRQERELIRLAWTDSLTDAMNRHRFMDLAGKEIERTKRRNGELSLLLLDADHFKQINDKYGHAAGDAILKGLVERWTRSLRSHDLIGRIGGEEFSILLPEANAANAICTANRLRKEIAEVPFAFEGQLLRVTVSIGVATLAAGEDLPSLMQRADRALYRAKEAGRDEVIASAA
ncbi:diguanylate cyclase [Hoeflea alexandrii]|uniref:diguanylate cyclase n=2 Tax=Hoeflea alexandrii TaxID=288436 RepID=A0ABT1CUH6_9HYPH|nr:diguanylate cyclase [Hoeflea alexandrii]MCO6409845.1 diguanylate cyclase [Hoeflea alexandrii]